MLTIIPADAVPASAVVPLFRTGVPAGRPVATDGDVDRVVDLHELVGAVHRDTFFARVDGLSMIEAGIFPGDVVVVDARRQPKHADVVVAVVDGEPTLKRYMVRGHNGSAQAWLLPANPDEEAIFLGRAAEAEVQGVVTWVLHPQQP